MLNNFIAWINAEKVYFNIIVFRQELLDYKTSGLKNTLRFFCAFVKPGIAGKLRHKLGISTSVNSSTEIFV